MRENNNIYLYMHAIMEPEKIGDWTSHALLVLSPMIFVCVRVMKIGHHSL